MHYGGDYNPEQWPESIWLEDVRLMKQAGVTMVSLGIFSWSRIQPAEGVFDFDWLDRVVDLLHANGIAIDMATATASLPPWATAQYPQILPEDEFGVTYWPGGRQAYAPTSPIYRRLASELVTALAHRYSAHPAVTMWHVNNEYGCHVVADYSDNAVVAFRQWLTTKYQDIDALNAGWGTDFWSQRYTAFDQILPPRRTAAQSNPSGMLDFRRFTSDALISLYRMERDILRNAGATQPITTNFMGAFKPADYWKWAQEVDLVADDCYPDPHDPESFRAAAFQRDLMRSLKPGVPWLLMEQSTNALNWRTNNGEKPPGQMAALSMQAIGRGADGIMFFQWRQSRIGTEKFHSAMLPHAGLDTRTWREVLALGAELQALPQLSADAGSARVAMVFDWENWWAVENSDHPATFDYLQIVRRWYDALHAQHVQVDFVQAHADLTGYAVVIAPHVYLLTSAGAENLLSFVHRGGHLLVGSFSDIVDEQDAFRSGGYLTQLRATLGIRLEDFGALIQTATADGVRFTSPGGTGSGTHMAETIHLAGATALGYFEGPGPSSGRPAFTLARYGGGRAYYLATIPDEFSAEIVTAYVFAEAGVDPVLGGLPPRVEVARRGDLVTLINHSSDTVDIKVDGIDLLTSEVVNGVSLHPFEYALINSPGAPCASESPRRSTT